MNTQSPIKIFLTVAILLIVLITAYFSLNKTINVPKEDLTQAVTSTLNNATTSAYTKNGKPVITKLDLPQALNIDQKGTWVIHASSTDGKPLTYSAVWGDEVGGTNPAIVNNPTFTHVYSYPGVYNPVITIYGSNGQSVYASVGARVTGETKKAPIIYLLSPSSVTVGTSVNINGAGFTGPKILTNGPGNIPSNEVLFDGQSLAGVTSNGVNNLYFLIPDNAKIGKHSVQIKNPNGTSNTVSLMVIK